MPPRPAPMIVTVVAFSGWLMRGSLQRSSVPTTSGGGGASLTQTTPTGVRGGLEQRLEDIGTIGPREDDMTDRLISCDDHMDLSQLPADLWTTRLPASLLDRAPHVEERDGQAMWVC